MSFAHEDLSRAHDTHRGSDRVFGFVMTIVFGLFGVWPMINGLEPRFWALGVTVLLAIVAVFRPATLAPANTVWIKFGLLLNRLVSPLFLGMVFFLAVWPTGLALRLFGKDPLRLKRDPTSVSYWLPRRPPGPPPESMSNQF